MLKKYLKETKFPSLDNGAIVRSRYKVEPLENLIHIQEDEKILAVHCDYDYILLNVSHEKY